MIISFILIFNIIVVTAKDSPETGFCDASVRTCNGDTGYQKLLFYDVNPSEGFNLRRDVYMRFAIMLASARKKNEFDGWVLVLPPWYNLYHWSRDRQKHVTPLAWKSFFDIDSLKGYVPVEEFNDILTRMKYHVQIDTLYVLQNYDDPFEGGTFVDKWELNNNTKCNYDGNFWGYDNVNVKKIVCVRFQGPTSKLVEVMNMNPNDQIVMFAHGEIPLHDFYGSKDYWDCRKSMKFCKKLTKKAETYIKENFDCELEKCHSYISVHLRRQDFARNRKEDIPTIKGAAIQIEKVLMKVKLKNKKVFIATDSLKSEQEQLAQGLRNLGIRSYFYPATASSTLKDGQLAIIEQIVCSRAAFFIGTYESTFTFRIQEEREILGFDSETTFNRLCPDVGRCDKPSVWKIIK